MAIASNGDVFLSDMEAGTVYVLRDDNKDGVADQRFTFATGLNEPYGLAFNAGFLYVSDVHSVVRFPYEDGQFKASGGPEKVTDLTKDGTRKVPIFGLIPVDGAVVSLIILLNHCTDTQLRNVKETLIIV